MEQVHRVELFAALDIRAQHGTVCSAVTALRTATRRFCKQKVVFEMAARSDKGEHSPTYCTSVSG
jgi:hypothetical protein